MAGYGATSEMPVVWARRVVRTQVRNVLATKITAPRASVYIPFGTAFMNLVSSSAGNVRTILLSLPDSDDMMRGIISTLSNPKGSIHIRLSHTSLGRDLSVNGWSTH
jgi:hypothetical protein